MTLTINKRNETADLLKGIAVFFMIQVHIMEQFTSYNIYNSTTGKLSLFFGGPLCAPVFLIVMGYFLMSNSKPLVYYLKRGLLLFAGGILLNILRSIHLFIYIIGGIATYKASFFIFGVDILTLAGLSIILIGFMRLIFKDNYIGYLIPAILIPFLAPYLPMFGLNHPALQYMNAFLWGNYGWSYFPLFPWFAYVLIGYTFHLLINKYANLVDFNKPKHYLFLAPILIILIATLKYGINTAHDLQGYLGYYHHGIKYFAWVIIFLIVYLVFINTIEKYIGNNFVMKFIKWTGRNVTAVYVVQWIIIGNIATGIYETQNIYQNIGWFIAITTVTCLLVLAWLKTIEYFKNKNESII